MNIPFQAVPLPISLLYPLDSPMTMRKILVALARPTVETVRLAKPRREPVPIARVLDVLYFIVPRAVGASVDETLHRRIGSEGALRRERVWVALPAGSDGISAFAFPVGLGAVVDAGDEWGDAFVRFVGVIGEIGGDGDRVGESDCEEAAEEEEDGCGDGK